MNVLSFLATVPVTDFLTAYFSLISKLFWSLIRPRNKFDVFFLFDEPYPLSFEHPVDGVFLNQIF